MGSGRVRMNIPRRAHRPPTSWQFSFYHQVSPVISHLARCWLWLELIAHRGEGHQGIPETVQKCPLRAFLLHKICHGRNLKVNKHWLGGFFLSFLNIVSKKRKPKQSYLQWEGWRLWGGGGDRVLCKPGSGCRWETAAQRNVGQVWKSSLSSSHEPNELFSLNIILWRISISKWEFNGCYSI